MRPQRLYSHKSQSTQPLNKSHIIQSHLDRKNQLINKYQTQTNDLIDQIDSKQAKQLAAKKNKILSTDKNARRRALSSMRRESATINYDGQGGNNNIGGGGNGNNIMFGSGGSLKDYNKLILGLEYALENQRKKSQELTQKNISLQSQISNLRNLLMGPDQQKHYQKTAYKQSQDKITYLQKRIIEQKKNYEFIIDSKNENQQIYKQQIKILKKSYETNGVNSPSVSNNDQALSRKVLQLLSQIQQLKNLITKKNIIIQRIKYQNIKDDNQDSDQDQQINKIRKAQKLKFYAQQMEVSNKLIMRKNVQIITLSNKIMLLQKMLDVIQLYLDKKEVRGVDLSVLQQPCVNKLRMLLRQKAVFQKQLLSQLNQHNKKIATFQTQLTGRDRTTSQKLTQLVNDNKRLASTVTNLQSNIANMQKQLQTQKRENQMLTTQITINKRQFIQEVTKLKEQLGAISSVTKHQFDRMKIQNLKLAQQNRSLLFLVGQKQRQIHKKGQAIKTFEQYRQKINTLNVGQVQKRKIQSVSQQPQGQIGTRLLTIDNFSNWLFEWNKIKNWTNKKTLLNLILDKQQIRGSALQNMGYLISVIQQCLLQSKNVQIQQRGIILLAYFVQSGILKNQNIYLNKILPVVVRGFRPIIQGQQQQKCRLLNQSTLSIFSYLSLMTPVYQWTHELTNQMLTVNGLKYLFGSIRKSLTDELIQKNYNVLIMIARANQMISFMLSFDLNTLIYTNLTTQYHYIIYLITLIKQLLKGTDYLKTQTSILQYRKLFTIIQKDNDQQLLQLTLQCILLLMQKSSIFTKSLQKLKCLSILSTILRKNNDQCTQNMLKMAAKVYINILIQLQQDNVNKYVKVQIDKILEIVKMRKINQYRFIRIIKMLVEVCSHVQDNNQLDEKVFLALIKMYEIYQQLEINMRGKLNQCINIIFERNKQLVNKYSNDTIISHFVQSYKQSQQVQNQLPFLLKILIFQGQQKRVTQILRTGRQSMINKIINDSLVADYNVAILAIKLLLIIVKEKYCQKFINQNLVNLIVKKMINQRGQEEYLGLVLSVLYFMGKIEGLTAMLVQGGVVAKICNVFMERHDKQPIIYKALAVLQVCHSMLYKKKILNYLISSDNSLQILKTLNFALRKSKNKVQMGTRAVFLYDYFNNPTSVQSLAILAQRNEWLIQDLIMLRNQYLNKVDSMVYKIQMLLHEMSNKSNNVKKIYQKYRVQGGEESDQGN